MRIVADSGSTKTSWALMVAGKEPVLFNTEGFNPFYVDSNYIQQSISNNFPKDFPYAQIKEVYFYGAGCVPGKSEIVEQALHSVFPNSQNAVSSDLFAAAKALVGDEHQFVSILGTGTNSAIFNQGAIEFQIPSLGFLLGDEGSGAYMGRKLLGLYAKGVLPTHLQEELASFLGLDSTEIVSVFYQQKLPNRFSATLVPFILKHIQEPVIRKIVIDSFKDFFENIVAHYPKYKNYTLNVMGSIAYNFKQMLDEVAQEFEMKIGKIYRSPMEGLISYHS